MIRISFSPQRRDDTLVLEKTSGDRLRVNGELFNFNGLNDGDTILAGAVPCDWFDGPVEKIDGEVNLTIILPYKVPRFGVETPDPIMVTDDGPITLPVLDHEEPADVEP